MRKQQNLKLNKRVLLNTVNELFHYSFIERIKLMIRYFDNVILS